MQKVPPEDTPESTRAQLCPTLWDPMDSSPPGSSIHGDSPGKWVAMPSARGSSQLRDRTQVSCFADSLPSEAPGKPKNTGVGSLSLLQGIFLSQESNRGLLHCRWIPYHLSYQGSSFILYYCLYNIIFYLFHTPVFIFLWQHKFQERKKGTFCLPHLCSQFLEKSLTQHSYPINVWWIKVKSSLSYEGRTLLILFIAENHYSV